MKRTATVCLLAGLVVLNLIWLGFRRDRNGADSAQESQSSRSSSQGRKGFARLPLSFEANMGQLAERVKFVSRGNGATLYLTAAESIWHFPGSESSQASAGEELPSRAGSTLQMRLLDANPERSISGQNVVPTRTHSYLGSDTRGWRTNIPSYERVKVDEVYPGIDLVYYVKDGHWEYDFVVAPGNDPTAIELAFSLQPEGASGAAQPELILDSGGDLTVRAGRNEVRHKKPYAYQEIEGVRHEIAASYRLGPENRVSFVLEEYDSRQPLVIDPVLVYSTYLGSSGEISGVSLGVDPLGNLYVAGTTTAVLFPAALPSTFSIGQRQGLDVFVMKVDAASHLPVYVAYLGGENSDKALGVAADAEGNAYVTGATQSSQFPVSEGAYQAAPKGPWDRFVSKLGPTGDQLLYSTLIGGSADGEVEADGGAITVDSSGHAYLTGNTDSPDFPTTGNAYQRSYRSGGADVFVAKMNASGSALVYSSLLGGTGVDLGKAIAVSANGSAYVTGTTSSINFPNVNGFQSRRAGQGRNAFLSRFSPSGSLLIYSTYLGGISQDEGTGIAVDAAGLAYLSGSTQSRDFPITSGGLKDRATRLAEESDNWDAYFAVVDASRPGSGSLLFCTYLGGTGDDFSTSIATNPAGRAYISGWTRSTNFPVASAIQDHLSSSEGSDVFITKFGGGRREVLYSTYLGGSASDSATASAWSGEGLWIGGLTDSTDLPTLNTVQPRGSATTDAFVARIADGDGSPAELIVTSAVALEPTSGHTTGSAVRALFRVTNRGGSAIHVSRMTLRVPDNSSAPEFSVLKNFTLDAGESISYDGKLTPISAGTYRYEISYLSDDGGWRTGLPVVVDGQNFAEITVSQGDNKPVPFSISTSLTDNQCVIAFGSFTCTANITWSTLNLPPDEVQVRVQNIGLGTPPTVFSSVASGSQEAPWIEAPPNKYRFTLNQVGPGVDRELAAVEVTARYGDPGVNVAAITATPNPCTIAEGSSTCSTTINWGSTVSLAQAEVLVQDFGGSAGQTLFAGDPSGSVSASWIQGPPHRYVFTLQSIESGKRTRISAVEVTGLAGTERNSSGTITASANPCLIAAGATECETVISWNTAPHVTQAKVAIRDQNASTNKFFDVGKSGQSTVSLKGPTNRYTFTLYQINNGLTTWLDAVEVEVKPQ
ncbi:MAG: SBBP repeat-containing protein [Acidobacteriota bacterium]